MYNQVKAVRRALRSLGFDVHQATRPGYLDSVAAGGAQGESPTLTRAQADGFQKQMERLNKLQLRFEEKVERFSRADLLDADDSAFVGANLREVESYLNHVVDAWMNGGQAPKETVRVQDVSDQLQDLFRVRVFKTRLSYPLREVVSVIGARISEDSDGPV